MNTYAIALTAISFCLITTAYSQEKEVDNDGKTPNSFTLDAHDATLEERVVQTEQLLEHKSPDTLEANATTGKSRKDDGMETLAGQEGHNGGFGAISFTATEFNDKNIMLLGFRGGWIINRTLAIGLEGYGLVPVAEYEGIDPDRGLSSRAVGGYGGLFLEPIIFSNKVLHATFPVSSGAGWVGYVEDWENNTYNHYHDELIDGDVFWYIQPGINAELNVARNFRLCLGGGYRFVSDLKLMDTPADAFDGWNYSLTLKFGSF